MSELWTPSDKMLLDDPIAAAQVQHPHKPPDLFDAGVVLPDDVGDDAENEAAAAAVLAELDDDTEPDEPGDCYDDDACDAPDEGGPGADV